MNRSEALKHYEISLEIDELNHSDTLFQEFMNVNSGIKCPNIGVYRYSDGEVICDLHMDDDEIPWL